MFYLHNIKTICYEMLYQKNTKIELLTFVAVVGVATRASVKSERRGFDWSCPSANMD